jgi:Fe-S-cluster containining protein
MAATGQFEEIFGVGPSPDPDLTAYFHTRWELAATASEFHCDPDCTRPGCKREDLQIPVSLMDLLGAARYRRESVAALFQRHYTLGLLAEGRHPWIKRLSLKLNKPCPFLREERCSIYPVRPLACILFPEYLAAEHRLAAEAAQTAFRDFLCLRRELRLSPQRTAIMARLKQMWERERLLAGFHLFGAGHCSVDFSNLTAELGERAKAREADSPVTIPHRGLEDFFQERLAALPPFDRVAAALSHLDDPQGQRQWREIWQDDRLARRLFQQGDRRSLVFRLIRGRLKGRRRSLTSGECHFY